MRLRGVFLARTQPLRHPDLRVRQSAGAGRLQQPSGLLLPPAHGLPAAVLRVSTAAGPGVVEVPTALPRDHVQGRDVFRLGWWDWRGFVLSFQVELEDYLEIVHWVGIVLLAQFTVTRVKLFASFYIFPVSIVNGVLSINNNI